MLMRTSTDTVKPKKELKFCCDAARDELMSLPVDSPELCNALCYILPFVAVADPAMEVVGRTSKTGASSAP